MRNLKNKKKIDSLKIFNKQVSGKQSLLPVPLCFPSGYIYKAFEPQQVSPIKVSIKPMFDKRTIRDLLNSGSELTSDEFRRLRSLWKQTSASHRVEIIGTTLDEATIFLVQQGALEKHELRLIKLLSLSISLTEAMSMQLTNYLSYISHLVRSYGINARNLLNLITEFIKTIEDQLYKEIDEQVEVYRNLEDESEGSEKVWGDTGQRELEVQEKNYDEVTWIEASKLITHERLAVRQHDTRMPNFCRTTKN